MQSKGDLNCNLIAPPLTQGEIPGRERGDSAWVLWHREDLTRTDDFDWHRTADHLRVPVLQTLFYQFVAPQQLRLLELMNWTTEALNRVDHPSFFECFSEEEAVQYFYEPFLQAFDPELRKELGVWYTPPEIVRYMVRRRGPAAVGAPPGCQLRSREGRHRSGVKRRRIISR